MKALGIWLLAFCSVCIFVAFERYESRPAVETNLVNAFRRVFSGGKVNGTPVDDEDIEPPNRPTPVIVKYALFFAALSGVGGGLVLRSQRTSARDPAPAARPDESACPECGTADS